MKRQRAGFTNEPDPAKLMIHGLAVVSSIQERTDYLAPQPSLPAHADLALQDSLALSAALQPSLPLQASLALQDSLSLSQQHFLSVSQDLPLQPSLPLQLLFALQASLALATGLSVVAPAS